MAEVNVSFDDTFQVEIDEDEVKASVDQYLSEYLGKYEDLEDAIKDGITNFFSDTEIASGIIRKAVNRAIGVDESSAPKSGLEHIRKLHGEDGHLVGQILHQIKDDINVMRLLVGEYKYYTQFCIAVGIDLDTYSRIRDHFVVQVNQELEGTEYKDDEVIRDAIAKSKPIGVTDRE